MRTGPGPMAGGALSLPPGCAARPGSAGAPRAVAAAATLEPCKKSRRDNPLPGSLESFIGYVLPWVNPQFESGDAIVSSGSGKDKEFVERKLALARSFSLT